MLERKNAEKVATQGTSQALQARSNQNFKNRGRGRGRSHGGHNGGRGTKSSEQNSEDNGGDQKIGSNRGGRHSRGRDRKGYDKRNIQCFTCSKYGHYSSKCWHNEDAKGTKNGELANLAQETGDSESDHVVLMSTVEERYENLTQKRFNREMIHLADKCNEAHVSITDSVTHAQGDQRHVLFSDEVRHAADNDELVQRTADDDEPPSHALFLNDTMMR